MANRQVTRRIRLCDNWNVNFLPRFIFNWRTFSRRVSVCWWRQWAKNQVSTNQKTRNRWYQIVRQTKCVSTLFITNNHALIHLKWNENLVNIRKSQSIMTRIVCKTLFCFLCLYQLLQLLKTVLFWLEFTLSFWKIVLDQSRKSISAKFGPHWKDRKNSYQVRQIWSFFCDLVAFNLELY